MRQVIRLTKGGFRSTWESWYVARWSDLGGEQTRRSFKVASGTEDWPTLVVDKPQNSLAKGARRNDPRKRPSGFYGICFGDCASQIRISSNFRHWPNRRLGACSSRTCPSNLAGRSKFALFQRQPYPQFPPSRWQSIAPSPNPTLCLAKTQAGLNTFEINNIQEGQTAVQWNVTM